MRKFITINEGTRTINLAHVIDATYRERSLAALRLTTGEIVELNETDSKEFHGVVDRDEGDVFDVSIGSIHEDVIVNVRTLSR